VWILRRRYVRDNDRMRSLYCVGPEVHNNIMFISLNGVKCALNFFVYSNIQNHIYSTGIYSNLILVILAY